MKRVLVMGDEGVGKTTIIERIGEEWSNGRWGLLFSSKEGRQIQLYFEESKPRGDADILAVIFVFDITKRQSFNRIKEYYYPEFQRLNPRSEVFSLLVSNKLDLESQRTVMLDEVLLFTNTDRRVCLRN